jgi:hypothetical protein
MESQKFTLQENFFNVALKRSKPPLPHHVLVVDVKEVFDLDKVKKIL